MSGYKPMRSFGGRLWTFAFWREFNGYRNWYLRLGSRSVFWRQPGSTEAVSDD
jgi:hypothetical protein